MERPEGGFPLGRDLEAEHRRVKWRVSSEMEKTANGRGPVSHDSDWNIFQPGGDPACSGRIVFINQMRQEIKTIRNNGRVVCGWRVLCGEGR